MLTTELQRKCRNKMWKTSHNEGKLQIKRNLHEKALFLYLHIFFRKIRLLSLLNYLDYSSWQRLAGCNMIFTLQSILQIGSISYKRILVYDFPSKQIVVRALASELKAKWFNTRLAQQTSFSRSTNGNGYLTL